MHILYRSPKTLDILQQIINKYENNEGKSVAILTQGGTPISLQIVIFFLFFITDIMDIESLQKGIPDGAYLLFFIILL